MSASAQFLKNLVELTKRGLGEGTEQFLRESGQALETLATKAIQAGGRLEGTEGAQLQKLYVDYVRIARSERAKLVEKGLVDNALLNAEIRNDFFNGVLKSVGKTNDERAMLRMALVGWKFDGQGEKVTLLNQKGVMTKAEYESFRTVTPEKAKVAGYTDVAMTNWKLVNENEQAKLAILKREAIKDSADANAQQTAKKAARDQVAADARAAQERAATLQRQADETAATNKAKLETRVSAGAELDGAIISGDPQRIAAAVEAVRTLSKTDDNVLLLGSKSPARHPDIVRQELLAGSKVTPEELNATQAHFVQAAERAKTLKAHQSQMGAVDALADSSDATRVDEAFNALKQTSEGQGLIVENGAVRRALSPPDETLERLRRAKADDPVAVAEFEALKRTRVDEAQRLAADVDSHILDIKQWELDKYGKKELEDIAVARRMFTNDEEFARYMRVRNALIQPEIEDTIRQTTGKLSLIVKFGGTVEGDALSKLKSFLKDPAVNLLAEGSNPNPRRLFGLRAPEPIKPEEVLQKIDRLQPINEEEFQALEGFYRHFSAGRAAPRLEQSSAAVPSLIGTNTRAWGMQALRMAREEVSNMLTTEGGKPVPWHVTREFQTGQIPGKPTVFAHEKPVRAIGLGLAVSTGALMVGTFGEAALLKGGKDLNWFEAFAFGQVYRTDGGWGASHVDDKTGLHDASTFQINQYKGEGGLTAKGFVSDTLKYTKVKISEDEIKNQSLLPNTIYEIATGLQKYGPNFRQRDIAAYAVFLGESIGVKVDFSKNADAKDGLAGVFTQLVNHTQARTVSNEIAELLVGNGANKKFITWASELAQVTIPVDSKGEAQKNAITPALLLDIAIKLQNNVANIDVRRGEAFATAIQQIIKPDAKGTKSSEKPDESGSKNIYQQTIDLAYNHYATSLKNSGLAGKFYAEQLGGQFSTAGDAQSKAIYIKLQNAAYRDSPEGETLARLFFGKSLKDATGKDDKDEIVAWLKNKATAIVDATRVQQEAEIAAARLAQGVAAGSSVSAEAEANQRRDNDTLRRIQESSRQITKVTETEFQQKGLPDLANPKYYPNFEGKKDDLLKIFRSSSNPDQATEALRKAFPKANDADIRGFHEPAFGLK